MLYTHKSYFSFLWRNIIIMLSLTFSLFIDPLSLLFFSLLWAQDVMDQSVFVKWWVSFQTTWNSENKWRQNRIHHFLYSIEDGRYCKRLSKYMSISSFIQVIDFKLTYCIANEEEILFLISSAAVHIRFMKKHKAEMFKQDHKCVVFLDKESTNLHSVFI